MITANRLVAALTIAGSLTLAPTRATGQDTRVTLSAGGERISIVSAGGTRAQLLETLRSKYQIEVRPYIQPDERISVRVENAPIDSAIARIMPRGSHYVVRFGERDVLTTLGRTSAKRGPKEVRAAGLVPKRESRPIRPRGPGFKPDPERVVEPTQPRGRSLKPVADANRTVPPGLGPKRPRTALGSSDSTLHISLIIRAPDSIRVTGAAMIAGATPASTVVHGPFVFVVRNAAGAILTFGTLLDPLEEHSYENPSPGEHAHSRAREGTFTVTVPGRLVTQMAGARLEFYDATNASLPGSLDARALERIIARSKRAGRVDGRAVVTALRRGTR